MKSVLTAISSLVILLSLVLIQPATTTIMIKPSYAQNGSSSNTTSNDLSNTNNTTMSSSSSLSSSSSPTSSQNLSAEMKRIESSDNPVGIATLAYIWGYPLISMKRMTDFLTSPNVPTTPGRGPINTLIHVRDLTNASITEIVHPNVDTLYSIAYLDLTKGPLVFQVPLISDRYYTEQFTDAYSNSFRYIGTRTNVTSGGTYLITGPDWIGKVPNSMTQIKSPTNLMWIGGRLLVNGPEELPKVRALQDKFALTPLSMFKDKTRINPVGTTTTTTTIINTTKKEVPVSPQPSFIPKTGIKIFDEIGKDMVGNPPYQYDAGIVTKFKLIGIGPGLTPSTETANATIKQALQEGIEQGEKLIDYKTTHSSALVNGWSFNLNSGNFGTDYLLRAAIAKNSLNENIAEEALYPKAFVDGKGNTLTGTQKYVLHFDKNKIPPVKAFWSLTMYNSKAYLVDNPINRFAIGDRTPGLKYNPDGSLDIYIQHDNPGKEKESNWLPAPSDNFHLQLRMYIPEEIVLKGEYQIPPVQRVS
jgi:hypothetical protein